MIPKRLYSFYLFSIIVLCGHADNSTKSTSQKVDTVKVDCKYGFYFNGTSCTDCGIFSPKTRIVGGIKAEKGSWPAQVLIIQSAYISQLNKVVPLQCGGTLINRNTVLTASHCIGTEIRIGQSNYKIEPNIRFPTLESMFKIYIGAHNIDFVKYGDKPPNEVTVANAAKIVRHESYDDETMVNDIALIFLSQTVTPSLTVNIACLPVQSDSFPGYNLISYASGWGTLYQGGPTPDVLYTVNLTIYEPIFCNFVDLERSQLCAGEILGGKDTCQGDSGGGLMVNQSITEKNKYVIAGIVSYGYGCGLKNYPGIYTRVSYYIDWIKANILVHNNILTIDTNNPNKTEFQFSTSNTIYLIRTKVLNLCLITSAILSML